MVYSKNCNKTKLLGIYSKTRNHAKKKETRRKSKR